MIQSQQAIRTGWIYSIIFNWRLYENEICYPWKAHLREPYSVWPRNGQISNCSGPKCSRKRFLFTALARSLWWNFKPLKVAWWKGISTEDIIDTKEDLQKYFYAIYRFIARFVDYIEDIAIASCKIEIIKAVAEVVDPLFGKKIFRFRFLSLFRRNRRRPSTKFWLGADASSRKLHD